MSDKKQVLDTDDANDLAAVICGISDDAEQSEIDEALWNNFQIDSDNFYKLMNKVYGMMSVGITAFNQEPVVCLATKDTIVVKKTVKSQFISSIIEWLTKDEFEQSDGTYIVSVTVEDVKKFEILLTKFNKESNG